MPKQHSTRHRRRYPKDWKETRARIIARDAETCRYCGTAANCVDHVLPYVHGGSEDDENLVAACRSCNSRAKDDVFLSFDHKRAWLRGEPPPAYAAPIEPEDMLAVTGMVTSVCPCGNPFVPGRGSATMVLCDRCAKEDREAAIPEILRVTRFKPRWSVES
jgi:hypothetical protein